MIKVMIVDDEIPSQKELSFIINQHPDFNVVGIAGSGREAMDMLGKLEPQVAFLDIQLYDINGLELAQRLASIRKDLVIIFATAHDDYAVKAFELNALDYVVKPFDELRIYKTLDRVAQNLGKEHQAVSPDEGPENSPALERICALGNDRWSVINCTDIVYVTAQDRKTLIKLQDRLLPSFYSLHELHEKLDRKDFLRVHRCYLVNMRFIKEVIPWFNGSYKLVMTDESKSEIPVSRNYAKPLKQKIGIRPIS